MRFKTVYKKPLTKIPMTVRISEDGKITEYLARTAIVSGDVVITRVDGSTLVLKGSNIEMEVGGE